MTATDNGGSMTQEESHRGSSRPPVRQRGDALPPGALQRAVLLVGAVHDEGPDVVARLLKPLDRNDLNALAVTLAALVPADYTPGELLAWNDAQYATPLPAPAAEDQPPLFPAVDAQGHLLKPHGTHAAFNRHKKNGEDPCAVCVLGEERYQADRYVKRREKAQGVA